MLCRHQDTKSGRRASHTRETGWARLRPWEYEQLRAGLLLLTGPSPPWVGGIAIYSGGTNIWVLALLTDADIFSSRRFSGKEKKSRKRKVGHAVWEEKRDRDEAC